MTTMTPTKVILWTLIFAWTVCYSLSLVHVSSALGDNYDNNSRLRLSSRTSNSHTTTKEKIDIIPPIRVRHDSYFPHPDRHDPSLVLTNTSSRTTTSPQDIFLPRHHHVSFLSSSSISKSHVIIPQDMPSLSMETSAENIRNSGIREEQQLAFKLHSSNPPRNSYVNESSSFFLDTYPHVSMSSSSIQERGGNRGAKRRHRVVEHVSEHRDHENEDVIFLLSPGNEDGLREVGNVIASHDDKDGDDEIQEHIEHDTTTHKVRLPLDQENGHKDKLGHPSLSPVERVDKEDRNFFSNLPSIFDRITTLRSVLTRVGLDTRKRGWDSSSDATGGFRVSDFPISPGSYLVRLFSSLLNIMPFQEVSWRHLANG